MHMLDKLPDAAKSRGDDDSAVRGRSRSDRPIGTDPVPPVDNNKYPVITYSINPLREAF